jgi:signal transduction histidine kinase
MVSATSSHSPAPGEVCSTIVVADADPRVRAAFHRYLDGASRVLEATTGAEAIELVRVERAAGGRIDAAYVDVDTEGLDLVRTILALDPDVMCVAMGADHDAKVRHAVALGSQIRREAEASVERARLEAERRLANKLEGIGQLAAGIAHEINTPTQYILSNAEMLDLVLVDLPGLGDDIHDAVRSIVSGAKSIARIVGAMREFSRSDAPEMRPADLNRAVQATLEVVRHEYRQVAEIELALGDLPQVHCHVGEIQQVLANLIVNAAHAIDRREPRIDGRIRIESAHDRARNRVELAISDNGVGIPAEIRDRVFDPFFTTKPIGRGTGQGLAIAHNVVARHAGALAFDSTPGVGTRFVVSLPVRGPIRGTP